MAHPNLIDKLRAALAPSARQALDTLTDVAFRQGASLYLVGGALRDLLLDRPIVDADLALEGDATALARSAAQRLAGIRCAVHPAFGTATLKGTDFRLDVATTRAETYERPGALPAVRPGSLRDDLFRRDFTVNAMALTLTGDAPGQLIDPFGGQSDLQAEILRVLHQASFQDDATRILRAARYESRLGFRLEPDSLRWLKRDVGYLETISGARIRDELLRILHEPEPERILLRLQELRALTAVHPALTFDDRRADAFGRLREQRGESQIAACLALLAWDLSPEQASALASRLALTKREAQAALAAPRARALEAELAAGPKPSRVVEMLSSLPLSAVRALAAATADPNAREQTLHYLRRWRLARPSLNGDDLIAMGAAPGPRLGETLRRLHAAKLDGELRTRRDEEKLARSLLGLPEGDSLHQEPPQKARPEPGRRDNKQP